jgi:hypothetical protein
MEPGITSSEGMRQRNIGAAEALRSAPAKAGTAVERVRARGAAIVREFNTLSLPMLSRLFSLLDGFFFLALGAICLFAP